MDVFRSIKETNRLLKEINWLLSKKKLNIYLKAAIEKRRCTQNFYFLSLKKVRLRAVFLGEPQLP